MAKMSQFCIKNLDLLDYWLEKLFSLNYVPLLYNNNKFYSFGTYFICSITMLLSVRLKNILQLGSKED